MIRGLAGRRRGRYNRRVKARYLIIGATVIALVALGLARLRRDPLRELFAEAIPAWQVARTRPDGAARAEPARRMERLAARRLPALVGLFDRLDGEWPDDAKVRAVASEINAALRAREVPYHLDVQPIREQPIVLTYERQAVVPWRLPEGRAVDVVRIRRLDHLNIEMGLYGEAAVRGEPVVYLDRIEARLADELPRAFQDRPGGDEVEQAVLAQVRRVLSAGPEGAALAESVRLLAERDRLFEVMRKRLHGDGMVIEHPDRFVFGEAWAEEMAPYARFSQPGGPLVLDTDLRAVARADDELASRDRHLPLERAVDLFAAVVEAHEAHHALDAPTGAPPPGELLELLSGTDPRFATLADNELRAYLGELHDGPASPCLALAESVRGVHGEHVGRTPHFFARRVLLARLGAGLEKPPETPAALLALLCALSDDELRRRAASVFQALYGTPLVPARRGAPR